MRESSRNLDSFMRITCPNCGAHYEVPESKLSGRKAVRCSRCGVDWSPLAETVMEPEAAPVMSRLEDVHLPPPEPIEPEPIVEEELAVPVAAEPVPPTQGFTAMQRLSQAAEAPAPSIWLRVAWGLSIVLLIAVLWSVFSWRADIMRVWPPSARAYAALGLTQQPR